MLAGAEQLQVVEVVVVVAALAVVVELLLCAACVSVADVLKLLGVQKEMETAMALVVRTMLVLALQLLAQKALLRESRGT